MAINSLIAKWLLSSRWASLRAFNDEPRYGNVPPFLLFPQFFIRHMSLTPNRPEG